MINLQLTKEQVKDIIATIHEEIENTQELIDEDGFDEDEQDVKADIIEHVAMARTALAAIEQQAGVTYRQVMDEYHEKHKDSRKTYLVSVTAVVVGDGSSAQLRRLFNDAITTVESRRPDDVKSYDVDRDETEAWPEDED